MTHDQRPTRLTLQRNRLAPKKRFGQNFLVHRATADAIVRGSRISAADRVVEVGVGLGALTIPLASVARQVFGYEIDRGIVRYHQEQQDLPDNVTLVEGDILTADFAALAEQCGGKIKILANLPYSISNPFLFKLIDHAALLDSATIMLQKEVADRLTAQPHTKEYGVLTVLMASCATVGRLMTLKPGEFHPRPKIDSVVVRIDFANPPSAAESNCRYDFGLLRHLVRATFNQRRKTILNSLSSAALFTPEFQQDKAGHKQLILHLVDLAGLRPTDRPETLTLADFVRLTRQVDRARQAVLAGQDPRSTLQDR